MNRNDEQFDEFLRSQFEHKTFEMKDYYWKNAQQMIANHRVTAGQGMLNAVFSGIVLVALSAGLLWNSANTPSAAKQEQPAFLASSELPLEMNTPVETGNVDLQIRPNKYESGATNNSVSASDPQSQKSTPNSSVADTKPKSYWSHHQRTRKSVMDKQKNTPAVEADIEDVIPTTVSDVTYINGKLFKPFRKSQKGLVSDVPKTDFLTYTANRSKGFLTIEGGLNGYNHLSDIAQSLNFHAGLRYYRFLNPKFALSSGVTYSRLKQNMDSRVFRNVDYSFGQNTNETNITTLRLDYIEIPLSAYYNIKGNHYIQAGATVGYAIQSNDLVELNGNKEQSVNGYMDGINKIDIQLNVGYACLIQNKYTLSATYYTGVMDVSKNASFQTNKADFNSGIRLTVGYKIF